MITLKDIENKKESLAVLLYNLAKENSTILDQISDTIYLSILGAQICYWNFQVDSLLEKIENQSINELKSFLIKLQEKKHFSIFAHTPLYIPLRENNYLKEYLVNIFKVWRDNQYYYLTFRHIAEGLYPDLFSDLIERLDFKVRFSKLKILDIYKIKYNFCGDLVTNIRGYSYSLKNSNRWFTFILENISRVCSHQFVRHTYLNFNQKSQRYTAINEFTFFYFPKELLKWRNILRDKILNYYRDLKLLFDKLEFNPKKEDFRYLMPQNVGTTLIVSGWDWQWEDFVNKRIIKEAQEEIRVIAEIIKDMIK